MTERIGSAEIFIDVNDREAIASLDRLRAEFDRDMRRMDGKEAEFRITGNLSDLKRTLKEAEALEKAHEEKIAALRKRYDEEESRGKKAAITKEIRQREQAIKKIRDGTDALEAQGKVAERHLDTLKRTNRERDIAARKENEQAKLEQRTAKIAEDAAKRKKKLDDDFEKQRRKNAEDYQRLQERSEKARMDEIARARKVEESLARERTRNFQQSAKLREQAVTQQARESQEVHKTELAVRKLEQAYLRAQQRRDKADRDLRKVGTRLSPATNQRVEIDKAAAIAEMAALKAELSAMGREPPVHIKTDVDDHNNVLSRWAKGLTEATVRVGPFTTTIAGLAKSLLLLGPVIMGLLGWLSALTGAVGAGLAGALGVASAAAAGFGMAALGIFAILKPLVSDFNDAHKATLAYNKAVREHGKDSDEAAKKLDILNHVLGDVPKRTRDQYIELGKLRDRWKTLTASARPEFWKLMGEGIQTTSDLMPLFAKQSTTAFRALSQGLQGWMRGIRSGEGQSVISTIFGNFNKALPSMLAGLGNLGGAIGHIAASFSRFLGPMGHAFERWSQGVLDASRNTTSLNHTADSLVNSLKAVWNFTKAAGRVLFEFFRAAAGPGTSSLNTMGNSLSHLADSMSTVAGQTKLRDFFNESIQSTRDLWGAVAPLLKLFIEFTTIMRPMTNVGLQMAGALLNLSHAVLSFGPVKGLMQAAFAIFLTRAIVGKIQAVSGAITALIGRFAALRAAQTSTTAFSAASAASNFVPLGGRAYGAGEKAMADAAKTEQAAGRMARAGAVASKGAKGFGALLSVVSGLPPPLALAVAALAAVEGGLYLLDKAIHPVDHTISNLENSIQRSEQATKNAQQRYRDFADAAGDTHTQLDMANRSVREANKAVRESKAGTQAHRDAIVDRNQAMRESIKLDMQFQQESQGRNRNARSEYANIAEEQRNNNKLIDEYRKKVKDGGLAGTVASKLLEGALVRQRQLAGALEVSQNRLAALPIQNQRAMKDMIALTDQAEQSIGKLARQAGGKKIATTIGIKYEDPRKAGQVASAARRALNQGIGRSTVMRIVADTRSADAAIRRLNNVRLRETQFRVRAFTDSALLALAGVNDKKVRDKVLNILGNAREAKRAHQVIHNLPNINKVLSMLGKNQAARRAHQAIASMSNITKVLTITANTSAARTAIDAMRSIKLPPIYQDVFARRKNKGADGGAFAGGGYATTPNERQQDRAATTAALSGNPRDAVSQKVTSPRYLVGEEGRPEFVVSTNPAYRKRNRKYAMMAARAVGLNVIAAAAGTAPESNFAPSNVTDGLVGNNEFDDAGGLGSYRIGQNAPPPDPPRSAKVFSVKEYRADKKGGKRRAAAVALSNSWNSWLGRMGKGETMLQRELGIQEAGLQQPDSFLIETKNPDPDNPGQTISTFSIDKDKRDKYAADLVRVREWYDTLLNWIATEARNLREAIAAFAEQKKAGQALKAEAAAAEKHHKAMLEAELKKKGKGKGKDKHGVDHGTAGTTNSDVVRKLRKAISADEAASRKGDDWQTAAKTRSGAANARISEVGYDFRENVTRRNALETERAALEGTAAQQLSDAIGNGVGSGSGGGGGGGDGTSGRQEGVTYEGQLARLDTERANVLREFGSNFSPNVGGTSGPSGPSGPSSLSLGGIGQVSSGALVASALTGSSAYSGGGSSAVMAALSGGAGGSALAGLSGGGVYAPGDAGATGGSTTVFNQTNNFQQPPPDPHTFAQGTAFEIGATI